MPVIVEQVSVCIKFNNAEGKSLVTDCLTLFTDCVNDDTLLKSLNLAVLMHARSEDVRLRVFALTCSETLWTAHGGKLLGQLSTYPLFTYALIRCEGFVPETTTFIAECAEDENDSVVTQCQKLKIAVESVAGSLAEI